MDLHGDFYSMKYQYLFTLKYMYALQEKSGYEEFIMYPSPMSYFITPLFLIFPSRTSVAHYSKYFRYVFFWMENAVIVIFFFFYFLALTPLIYIKTCIDIIRKAPFLKEFLFLPLWLFLGPLYLLYTVFLDICILLSILCVH